MGCPSHRSRGISQFIITPLRQCRPGFVESDYNFSADMLSKMISELDRLIDKYENGQDLNGQNWSTKPTANRVVELLVEHRGLIQVELNQVNSGVRQLKERDFLGSKEREQRRRMKVQKNSARDRPTNSEKADHSAYFKALERKVKGKKLQKMKEMSGMRMGVLDSEPLLK